MIVIQGEELGEVRVAGVTMSSFRNTAVVYPDAILRVLRRGSTLDAIPQGPRNSTAILLGYACYKSHGRKTIRIAAGSGRKPPELFP
jgi:hypothetical protein